MGDSDSEIEFNQAHIRLNQGQGDQVSTPQSPRYINDFGQNVGNNDGHDSRKNYLWTTAILQPSITIKPDKFTGDEDWEQYISHFEDCAELGQWSDREMFLTLAASLKGQARVFYTSLPLTEKRNYQQLTFALEQRFGSVRQQARWLSKFQARSKLVGESIATFGDDLRLLARKAYGNLEPEAQEMLALQQFYKALSVDMRCRVLDKNCSNIAEAVEVVERYEDLLAESYSGGDRRRNFVRHVGIENGNNSVSFDNNNNSGRYRNITQDGNDLQKTLRSIQFRLDRIERGQRKRPQNDQRACYFCKSTEHLYRNCPNRLDRNDASQQRTEASDIQGNELPSSL